MEKAVGFVVDIRADYVVVYGLRRGWICCPKERFDSDTWASVALGQWMELEVEQHENRHVDCNWIATSVKNLAAAAPLDIWNRPKDKITFWITRVRAVVGMTFDDFFGIAWSPLIGRIQICRKHVSQVHYGQDLEMEVHLSVGRRFAEHWVSKKILDPDPTQFINWCQLEMRIFVARISEIEDEIAGTLQETNGKERIRFAYSDFCLTHGQRNLKKVGVVGTEWKVLAYSQTEQNNDISWRAIAVLPRDPEHQFANPEIGARGNGVVSTGRVNEEETLPMVEIGPEPAASMTADASSQTEESDERKFIRLICADTGVFSQICGNQDMVRKLMSLNIRT